MSATPLFTLQEGTIETAVAVSQQIPEFTNPHGAEKYYERLSNVPHLILIAYVGNQPVGFKVGYERADTFYSWMGGVLPAFRRFGIAQALAGAQERWARERGYRHLTFKTRNRHKAMLVFALKNGFDLIGFTERTPRSESRILLRKEL